MSTEADRRAGRILEAMTLLSVASTAFDLAQKQHEIREGRDPTTSESVLSVRAFIMESFSKLREMLGQIKIQSILNPVDKDEEDALAHCFHQKMLLVHIQNHFSVIHQKLMSLFPNVDAALVETARRLTIESEKLIDVTGRQGSHLVDFADKGFRFISAVEDCF